MGSGNRPNIIGAEGLHVLKRRFQKRFLAQQCTDLVNCLEGAIAATMEVAPVREGKRYIKERTEPREIKAAEARWEEALFWAWKDPSPGSFAPWTHLLSYQINVENKKKKGQNWGEIDLLGVSKDKLPVVVELKAPKSNESPVQMLVQATAYGVALMKAWSPCFRAEWAKETVVSEEELPPTLSTCELVCAAPSEYWVNWTGDTYRARSVEPNVWAALADLRKSLARIGFPSVFLRLNHEGPPEQPSAITLVQETLPDGERSITLPTQ